MRKSLIYGTFLAAAMCSCNGDYDDWASPQVHEQEDPISVSLSVASADPIDIGMLAEGTETVQVCQITSSTAADSTYTNTYQLYLENNETSPVVYDITAGGMMSVADLQGYIESTYGKNPVERDMTAQVRMIAKRGAESVYLESDPFSLKAKTVAPDISSAYYLVGDMFGWDATSMQQFSHSETNVYDDPVFTISFVTTAADQYWKIIPQSNVDAGDIWLNPGVVGVATDGDDSMSGNLVNNGAGAGKIATPGKYTMTINMLEYTYSIVKAPDVLYMAGDANGWAQIDPLSSTADGVFMGYMYLNQNGFKFCTQQNWDGINYGQDFNTAGDAANWSMTEPDGYYQVTVDLNTPALTLVPISTIGLIGDATAGGWDTSTPMTFNQSERCWEVTATLTDGTMKFRANDAWDINWGGTLDNLTSNGDNIPVTAGTYLIKIYPNCPGQAYATMEAQ